MANTVLSSTATMLPRFIPTSTFLVTTAQLCFCEFFLDFTYTWDHVAFPFCVGLNSPSHACKMVVVVQWLRWVWFLWPHALQPAKLSCPRNFQGKNSGVDCHFLLREILPIHGLNPHLLHCRQIPYCWPTSSTHTYTHRHTAFSSLIHLWTLKLCLCFGCGE